MVLGISDQRLLHPGGDFESVVDEHVDHGAAAARRRAHQSGVLDGARQVKVVGRLGADGDAHAGPVDVGDRLERRVVAHHVGALDDDIGRAELDDRGADRLDRDKGDVPVAAARVVEHLAGGVVGYQLDRNAQPPPEFVREVGRDAFDLSGGFVLLRQYRIAEIDRGAQLSDGRQFLERVSCDGRARQGRIWGGYRHGRIASRTHIACKV